MKVFITRDCIDHKRKFHEKGSTPVIDGVLDKKLLDVGNAEEYDAKKHKAKENKKNENNDALLKEIESLKLLIPKHETGDAEKPDNAKKGK